MTLHYKFPENVTLDEVKRVLKDNDNYAVVEKPGHVVVNYVKSGNDTHPPVIDRDTAVLRELRGMIFHPVTGEVLSRRFQKFFNLGEREDVMNIDISKPHVILEKLDGSMITPVWVDGVLRWCTKMGVTDFAEPVEAFVKKHESIPYDAYAQLTLAMGCTPIFEWCTPDPEQRVVIHHPEPKLVLVAVRVNATGEYDTHTYKSGSVENIYRIPQVSVLEPMTDLDGFVAELRKREDTEGVVIRFDDGHMVKIKTDWYVSLHRAKSLLDNERDVVGLILDQKEDDLYPLLSAEDVEHLREFMKDVWHDLSYFTNRVKTILDDIQTKNISRKEFALTSDHLDPLVRTFVFSGWDDKTISMEKIKDYVLKHLGSGKSFERTKPIFVTAKWGNKSEE